MGSTKARDRLLDAVNGYLDDRNPDMDDGVKAAFRGLKATATTCDEILDAVHEVNNELRSLKNRITMVALGIGSTVAATAIIAALNNAS